MNVFTLVHMYRLCVYNIHNTLLFSHMAVDGGEKGEEKKERKKKQKKTKDSEVDAKSVSLQDVTQVGLDSIPKDADLM